MIGMGFTKPENPPKVPSSSLFACCPTDTQGTMRRTRAGLAMSQDGRNWARIEANHHTGALFDVGEDGQWDELLVGAPQVNSQCTLYSVSSKFSPSSCCF